MGNLVGEPLVTWKEVPQSEEECLTEMKECSIDTERKGVLNREPEGIVGKYDRMSNRVAQMDANSMGHVSESNNSSKMQLTALRV